jgi:hypothetical protein
MKEDRENVASHELERLMGRRAYESLLKLQAILSQANTVEDRLAGLEPKPARVAEFDEEGLFFGFTPRTCGEHRTVGSHRAWCHDCQEWCYPATPCVRCGGER